MVPWVYRSSRVNYHISKAISADTLYRWFISSEQQFSMMEKDKLEDKETNSQKQTDQKIKVKMESGDLGNDPGKDPSSSVENKPWYKRMSVIGAIGGSLAMAGVTVVAAPLVVGAMGFGAGGIVAGSIASQMMSAAAIANGGGVAAGSVVAILQSVGAAGFSLAGYVGLGAAGGAVGATVGALGGATADAINNHASGNMDKQENQPNPEENRDREEPANTENEGSALQSHPEQARLEISLCDAGETFHTFSLMMTDPLNIIFSEYAERSGLPLDTLLFVFNGLRLIGSETPEELGIKSGDFIRVNLL